jgi:uncharacterized protein (UPF0332 family)
MPGTKQDYIDYRVLKSKEIFEDVILLADNQRWNSAVNRLYYSCFYLISALLYKHDIKAETHNGTKTQFNLQFVKSGKIDLKYGKLYSNLFNWRQESDYADFIDFESETVKPLIEQVSELNDILLKLLKK